MLAQVVSNRLQPQFLLLNTQAMAFFFAQLNRRLLEIVYDTTTSEFLAAYGDILEGLELEGWQLIGQGRLENAWFVLNKMRELTLGTHLIRIPWANLSLCYMHMLEVDAAEKLVQHIVACSGAVGQLPADSLEQQIGGPCGHDLRLGSRDAHVGLVLRHASAHRRSCVRAGAKWQRR